MSDVIEAASVLLTRGPLSPELFVVRRGDALRFFGGFLAFPGGRVDPGDGDLGAPRAVAAAARELFEEAGVLLARRPDGTFPPAGADLDALRRDLLDGRLVFADLLARLGLTIRADDFTPAGRLVTPPFAAARFDTAFFVAHLPPGQEARVWPGELDDGFWTGAAGLLDRWTRGEVLVSPPTLSLLEASRGRPVDELPARAAPLFAALDAGTIPPIFFAPGVQMLPLRTMALPPSTHTNAYLVGTERTYLLDPGPKDADEQARLFAALDAASAGGRRLTAVVLTHHHPDHVGAAAACAARYDVPVWAHPWTAEALRDRVKVGRLLNDGDRVDLGAAPDGTPGWHLEALLTPGHAPGHLAFHDPHYRLLFASDMVSTQTSIVIAPPEGDLGVYLDSLRRLLTYDVRLLLPAHGGPTARARQTLLDALEHRRRREEQLRAALTDEPRGVADLAAELYRGLPAKLARLGELQTLAGLEKLARDGSAERAGDGWRRRATVE